MNRSDLLELATLRSHPSVSILMPTHPEPSGNQTDVIRLKNLVSAAHTQLLDALGERQAAPLMAAIDAQVAVVDLTRAQQGLAVFVSAEHAGAYLLPFAPPERVTLNETFATRDLLFALNRSPRYRVIALSLQATRVFAAVRENLSEDQHHGFPMRHEGPGGDASLPEVADKGIYAQRQQQQFYTRVARNLDRIHNADPLPLCVMGVDRALSHLRAAKPLADWTANVTGSFDRTPLHELGKTAWEAIEASFAAERGEHLTALAAAVNAGRVASGLDEAWRRTHEGRTLRLLVEEGLVQPAEKIAHGGLRPVANPNPAATTASTAGVLPDAIDELIEAALSFGGDVRFTPPGSLAAHQGVAAMLRY